MINEVSHWLLGELGPDIAGNGSECITESERVTLRDLAKRVAETASLPIMAARRAMWQRHNRLGRVRPMILVFPEGSWRELLPPSSLTCEGKVARGIEWTLRSRLYHSEHIHDDTVIERNWTIHKRISHSGWGLQAKHKPSRQSTGAWAFDPVIKEYSDLRKLRFPVVTYDEAGTRRDLKEAQGLFGDILDVQLKAVHAAEYRSDTSLGQVGVAVRGFFFCDDGHAPMLGYFQGEHETGNTAADNQKVCFYICHSYSKTT